MDIPQFTPPWPSWGNCRWFQLLPGVTGLLAQDSWCEFLWVRKCQSSAPLRLTSAEAAGTPTLSRKGVPAQTPPAKLESHLERREARGSLGGERLASSAREACVRPVQPSRGAGGPLPQDPAPSSRPPPCPSPLGAGWAGNSIQVSWRGMR